MCVTKIVHETWEKTLLTKTEGPLLTTTEYLKAGCLSQYLGLSFCSLEQRAQGIIHCPGPRYFFSVAAVSTLLLENKQLISVSFIPLAPSVLRCVLRVQR